VPSICWIHPTSKIERLEPLWAKLCDVVDPVLRVDIAVEQRFLAKSGNFTRSLYAEHLNSVHMVEAALQAQADGFDGVFLGCWNDPLWEAREVLDIPVASVGEQSMLAALAMGKRFAVITVSEKTASAIENDLLAYGLQHRAIQRPVRTIAPASDGSLLLDAVDDPSREFIPRFEEVAADCIHDGAEVIIVGCAYYGPLLRSAGYLDIPGTGVIVLDATTVALKYLEAMVDIAAVTGHVKSARGSTLAPPRAALNEARRALGLL
jgi:allantoin racemase